MKFCCVLTAVPTISKARQMAGLLISRRLAACVQIIPGIESHYCWKGKKETSREVLLIIKTRVPLYKPLEKAILKHHPYEVPEIVCLAIGQGSKTYLDWVRGETKKA